ncbi:MAG: hypothetical protein DRQ40_04380 [Gammaproteobacteria bacterium]|nr:MAG: hypothetical protein DRQ40_04380 [Gammaproteobacteria bacterium]
MKPTKELVDSVIRLDGNVDYKVVIASIEEFKKELTAILINTKADDVLVAQGMVRAIDQVLARIVKTKGK